MGADGTAVVWSVLTAALYAGCACWAFYHTGRAEAGLGSKRRMRQTALVDPLMLPLVLAALLPLLPLLAPGGDRWALAAYLLVLLAGYLSAYYALLLCALPLLRRRYSARTCAVLWLLPNYLYVAVYLQKRRLPPLLILTLPRDWLESAALVWGAGFALVLLWQVVSHLRYRRFLLRQARPVEDGEVLALWRQERQRCGMDRAIPVVASPRSRTPLTIGCFLGTMELVLPHLDYTQEELTLIFRHEARHIQRTDTRTKAFLGFCTALCWFNPLMWAARRKVSEDLELSCDELVLDHADAAERRRYAELLLDTAGDGRGYTTCLSGAACALRYRLRRVVRPGPRRSGAALVGAVLFVLLLGSGAFALADAPGTVQAQVFDPGLVGDTLHSIYLRNWGEASRSRYIYGWDEDALIEYLGSLSARQMYYANATPANRRRGIVLNYRADAGDGTSRWSYVTLCDGLLCLEFPLNRAGNRLAFRVDSEIDWDYVQSLLDFRAEDPDPDPQPPDLKLTFDEAEFGGEPLWAAKAVVRRNGVAGGGRPDTGVGGVCGAPVTRARLCFTYEPRDGCTVRVENWERTGSYTVSGDAVAGGILELAPYSAHYTVRGVFETVGETVYEMEFYFDVELPGA